MKYIKYFDYLSYKVSFSIGNKGNTKYKTFFGGLLSLLSFLLSIICCSYFLIRMLNRKDLSIIHSTIQNSFINLTYSHNLPFLLRVSDTNSVPYNEDEKLYYITSSIWYGGTNDSSLIGIAPQHSVSLNISKCDINIHFEKEYKKYFENFHNLSSYYCLLPRNYSQTIYGLYGNIYPFSYYSFTLRYCKNSTENNNSCYSYEEIKNKIKSPYFDVIFIDYSINALNQKQVKEITIRKERYELSLLLYKRIILYLENIKYITNNGYLFNNEEEENFYRYDSVRIDPSILEGQKAYFTTLSIMNSIKTSIYYKQYTKFQDYIAIIGGLFKFITLFFHLLNYFNSKNSYYLKLIKDFIINNEDYIIDQNSHVVQITSSLFGKSFVKIPNKTNISKNESISDLSNQKTTKIKQFNKINASLVSKVFPTLFIGKEAKFILELYKEFINKRLNVISILKKLEVIQINKNNYNKSITNINQMISPLKLLSTKINNYLNNNM